jgi:hypothetical protein
MKRLNPKSPKKRLPLRRLAVAAGAKVERKPGRWVNC